VFTGCVDVRVHPSVARSGGGGAYIPRWRGEARRQLQVEVKVAVVHAVVKSKLGPCLAQHGHLLWA